MYSLLQYIRHMRHVYLCCFYVIDNGALPSLDDVAAIIDILIKMGELRFSVSPILLYSNYTEYSFCDIRIYPHARGIEQSNAFPTCIPSEIPTVEIHKCFLAFRTNKIISITVLQICKSSNY